MKTFTLVLEVPDDLYQWLVKIAEREGKTVKQVAIEILEISVGKNKTESL